MFRYETADYIGIKLNKINSMKASDGGSVETNRRQLLKFTETPNYHLPTPNGKGEYDALIPNHQRLPVNGKVDPVIFRDPKDDNFNYVIVLVNDQPVLKIGTLGHVFLSKDATSVIAAGEIQFKDNKIHRTNDRSGAYCFNFNEVSPIDLLDYLNSLKKAMQEVGMPIKTLKLTPISIAKSVEFAVVLEAANNAASKNTMLAKELDELELDNALKGLNVSTSSLASSTDSLFNSAGTSLEASPAPTPSPRISANYSETSASSSSYTLFSQSSDVAVRKSSDALKKPSSRKISDPDAIKKPSSRKSSDVAVRNSSDTGLKK